MASSEFQFDFISPLLTTVGILFFLLCFFNHTQPSSIYNQIMFGELRRMNVRQVNNLLMRQYEINCSENAVRVTCMK